MHGKSGLRGMRFKMVPLFKLRQQSGPERYTTKTRRTRRKATTEELNR